MALVIATNIAALRAQRQLGSTSDFLSLIYERLASGQRINHASDDPAGLAVVSDLQKQIVIAKQALRNANDGISALAITDSALGSITEILQRIAELATQSANGAYSMRQRSVMELEVQALGSEIERIATVAEFNQIKLLSGSQEITIQVGFDSLSTSRIVVGAREGTLQALRLASVGESRFMYTCLGNTDSEAINHSRTLLAAAMDAIGAVGQTRGSVGANESRLNSAVNLLASQRENMQAAESRIKDVDVAQEAGKMIRLQILQQAQAAVLSHANLQPSRALALLK